MTAHLVDTGNVAARPRRRRTLLLRNPGARTGDDGAVALRDELARVGLDVADEVIAGDEDFCAAIRRLRAEIDLVVVGGGDGTLNAAVEGLVDTGLPLGVLPMGTANDLARSLTIPLSVADACEVIATGRERAIDLGRVNGHYFFNAAGMGLSVEVTRRLTGEIKRRWGVLGYARAVVDAWEARHAFSARIEADGQTHKLRSLQITIGNGRHYGGGMTIAEDATIDDARLDLYSLEPVSMWRLLGLAPSLRRGSHRRWQSVEVLRAKKFLIATEWPMPINADGEIVAHTPARFEVIPHALRVIVPLDYDTRREEMVGVEE